MSDDTTIVRLKRRVDALSKRIERDERDIRVIRELRIFWKWAIAIVSTITAIVGFVVSVKELL